MQTVKVGSIVEILNHDSLVGAGYTKHEVGYYMDHYPVGSQHEVLEYHQETGEVEIHYSPYAVRSEWHTFFPGEYKLVE